MLKDSLSVRELAESVTDTEHSDSSVWEPQSTPSDQVEFVSFENTIII